MPWLMLWLRTDRFDSPYMPFHPIQERDRGPKNPPNERDDSQKKNSMDNIKWSTYEHVRYLLSVSTGSVGGDCILVGIVPECCCSHSFCWSVHLGSDLWRQQITTFTDWTACLPQVSKRYTQPHTSTIHLPVAMDRVTSNHHRVVDCG